MTFKVEPLLKNKFIKKLFGGQRGFKMLFIVVKMSCIKSLRIEPFLKNRQV